jgi:hypothetical protein
MLKLLKNLGHILVILAIVSPQAFVWSLDWRVNQALPGGDKLGLDLD